MRKRCQIRYVKFVSAARRRFPLSTKNLRGVKTNPHAVRVLRSASDLTVDNCTSNSHSSVDDGTVLPNLTAPVTSFGTNLRGNAYLSTPAAVRGISYFVSGRESESESQSESVQKGESESESEQNHHDSETLHILVFLYSFYHQRVMHPVTGEVK